MEVPLSCSGQRRTSVAPPIGSTRMTSAPSWARVIPPSGAATKLETSRTRNPLSITAASCLDDGPARDQCVDVVVAERGQDRTAVHAGEGRWSGDHTLRPGEAGGRGGLHLTLEAFDEDLAGGVER